MITQDTAIGGQATQYGDPLYVRGDRAVPVTTRD
jgi:hypothetical protein